MGKHSNLGPIDPQVFGVPAYGVIEEFKTAACEIKKDPSRVHVWQPIISKYHPTFLSECENAIKHSSKIAQEHLEKNMFKDEPDRESKAQRVVERLTDYTGNGSHARHIHIDECKEIGLKVCDLESDQELQERVLTVHHSFMHTLMNTNTVKIIENHLGRALAKHQVVGKVQ